MKEYHKIETLFNRATDGSKKLVEDSWRNETVKYLKDNVWIWTEKIDGTNTRIHWNGHRVQIMGQDEESQIPGKLVNTLYDMFKTPEAEQLFEQKFGSTEVTLFGEGYGSGIQNKVGSKYRKDQSFILFDVWCSGIWLKRESVEDIAKAFGVEAVPVVGKGTVEEAVAYVKQKPMSMIGTAPMESVVIRPEVELMDRTGNRLIAKVKVRDFA